MLACVAYAIGLTGILFAPLACLVSYAVATDLHSHIVLAPAVSGWLLWRDRERLRVPLRTSAAGAAICGVGGGVLLMLAAGVWGPELSGSDTHAVFAGSYLALLVAGAFLFLGGGWMKEAAFPVCFLVFMIPLPEGAVDWMEHILMAASAEATNWLFELSGIPVIRTGQIFQLPGMTLEVAQQCSGIRSSWVLFITAVLASYLFLGTNWRRVLLVAAVIPLGILRNGLRVVVIGMLCVHKGPQMIDSWVHRQGGPLFFGLSLVPLFALLAWLRRNEQKAQGEAADRVGEKKKQAAPTRA